MQIQTGWGCPACKTSGITAMLFSQQMAGSKIFCMNGHEYLDMGELKAMNPEKLKVVMKQTLQTGHETFQVSLPGDIVTRLKGKFGTPERLVATLAGVLNALSQPKCFLISEEDVEQIEKITGQPIKSSSELKGLFWARNEELKQARDAAANPAQQVNGKDHSDGRYLDLSPVLPKLQALAKFRSQNLEQINESVLKTVVEALENGWV